VRASIVDYGMGNLASVAKAVERVGWSARVSSDRRELEGSKVVILPGVGNFEAGMANLRSRALDLFVTDWVTGERPLVGICLGMQMLFDHSDEAANPGLGLITGKVVRLPDGVKIPHMGWNEITASPSSVLAPYDRRRFYFVHSYACVPEDDDSVAATAEYGVPFAAAIHSGNLIGFQFHPEKSSADGISMLRTALQAVL
jgi:glutamine amidotransferase